MENKTDHISRMIEMQKRLQSIKEKPTENVKEEVQEETTLPSKYLSLNQVKLSTKELAKTTSYLDRMRNINDQYEDIKMTEQQANKVRKEMLRLTTGVASVVPLNCKRSCLRI